MKPECPCCNSEKNPSEIRNHVINYGHFLRKSDLQVIQRYRCQNCGKSFSSASKDPCYQQKKRHLNQTIYEILMSSVTQRRCAMLLRINRKTVARKFVFMGKAAIQRLPKLNFHHPKVKVLEFDDLITMEHTKCKPLAVTIAVEYKTRRILGFRVAQIPANGPLAKFSREKYGPRKNESFQRRDELFEEVKPFIEEEALIKSDQNPHYPASVKKHFPKATHKTYKGRRGCVTGQGELKAGGFDPLFSLNHTYAMHRANISRLVRRTWATTKKVECLRYHIALYACFHNLVLLNK